METKNRTIEERDIGVCPYCNSQAYDRQNMEASDDAIFFDCRCQECDKDFKETFRLRWQEWEE